MSEGRAIINFIGNTVATVVIAKSENEIDMETYKRVVGGQTPWEGLREETAAKKSATCQPFFNVATSL